MKRYSRQENHLIRFTRTLPTEKSDLNVQEKINMVELLEEEEIKIEKYEKQMKRL